jgi:hypothetical protein
LKFHLVIRVRHQTALRIQDRDWDHHRVFPIR